MKQEIKPFNKGIDGYQNEEEFVNYLNRKKVDQVNPMFYDFLTSIFEKIHNNDVIYAWKNDQIEKADIFIKINNIVKRISIKKGIKNSVHAELISVFLKFLIQNGFDQKTIEKIMKYHYADGTTDGTGKERFSVAQYKEKHQSEIDQINQLMNQSDFIRKAIDKLILRGNQGDKSIDCIIYGVVEDFIWIKKEEIIQILLDKKNEYSSGLHISHLSLQPMARCLNRNPRYEKNRHYIQAKWYNISDDIIEVMNNRK